MMASRGIVNMRAGSYMSIMSCVNSPTCSALHPYTVIHGTTGDFFHVEPTISEMLHGSSVKLQW